MTLIISPRLQKIYFKMPYLYEKIVRNSDKICVSLLSQASPCHKELSRISIGPNNLKRGKQKRVSFETTAKKAISRSSGNLFCSFFDSQEHSVRFWTWPWTWSSTWTLQPFWSLFVHNYMNFGFGFFGGPKLQLNVCTFM